MTFPAPVIPWSQKLGQQLESLSVVTEVLTVRLLELEERLQAFERRLDAELLEQVGESLGSSPATGEWLTSTEERLIRLEAMLAGRGSKEPHGVLAEVVAFPWSQTMEAEASPDGEDHGLDLFPEEEEQEFMDELIA